MLNQTSYKQVRPIINSVFRAYPTPQKMSLAREDDLIKLIRSLGFYNRRSKTLIRFSREWYTVTWAHPRELYGIGKYASDSYDMFVLMKTRTAQPTDKKLLAYKDWYTSQ